MQAPTHLIAGVLIQKSLKRVQPNFLRYFTIAFLAIFSHGLIDELTQFTYHPSVPFFKDWFWISYHIFMIVLAIFILIKFWKDYKFGMICAIFPDFEWIPVYLSKLSLNRFFCYKDPLIHNFSRSFFNALFPFNLLSFLPNWTLKKQAIIPELFLILILFVLLMFLQKRTRLFGKKST